jgi:hypothetical protein
LNPNRTINVSPTARCSQKSGAQAGVAPMSESSPDPASRRTPTAIDQSTIRAGGWRDLTSDLNVLTDTPRTISYFGRAER